MENSHKPHRKAKEKKKHSGPNPKAFSFSNPGKLQRSAARSHDIREKRLHVPLVDRLPDEPPPRLVAIVGPPGVGKTTLLKSLIRRYSKETITEPQGPITVVTSKKQRLTFIECPNELEGMVDIAKVADIVLLMIDGNFGFEMETMEFLNVLAATGMPGNIFGMLTHLDLFRKPQALKDAKKRLKHRLWTELYQGAHLFYLSGVINGRYPDREINNIARFLSVMKNPRPLIWRNSHPYAVIDNVRDVTHPTKIEENDRCDRSVALSGYLRGTNFAADGQRIHIPGVGDFTVSSVEVLPDPCPTPLMERAIAEATGKTKRKQLDEKEKRVYAPMSDRSGLKVDGDGVFIYREKGFAFDKDAKDVELGEGETLIRHLQGERRLLGHTSQGIRLFAGGEQITDLADEGAGRKNQRRARFAERGDESDGDYGLPDDEGFVSGDDEVDSATEYSEEKLGKLFRTRPDKPSGHGDVAFADSDSDLGSVLSIDEEEQDFDDSESDSDEGGGAAKWKEQMKERAKSLHGRRRPYQASDLARMMYDDSMSIDQVLKRWRGEHQDMDREENIEDEDDEGFFQKSKQAKTEDGPEDRTIPLFDYDQLAVKWTAGAIDALRKRFNSTTQEAGDEGNDDGGSELEDENDEGDGDFEDLETGEQFGQAAQSQNETEPAQLSVEEEREKNARRKTELKLRFEEEDREGFKNPKAAARREGGDDDEFGEDDWYDAQKALIQKQLDINQAEYGNLDERQRVSIEGLRAGQYAKIVIENVPAPFITNFQARLPIIVGGFAATEDRLGYVKVRIKRHRWHKKILKTNDPLIFSLGWRRFQSLPIYSTSDSRTRNRMLKYTPEHMHCFGTLYGPLIAPNTTFVCFQSFSPANPGFRIAATGTVLSVDESTEIFKKLKLTGAPAKIYKNTAFIKDMFNTALEIAKFEGAAIKTVSGIRGQIKRALSKPEGHFRATFEDKILMSDLVFLRAWYPVKPHRFYNPVTNLIGWHAMRLTWEIRRDEDLETPQQKNSQYRQIERADRHFNPLRVPRKLAASLPFKSQIVTTKKQKKETYMQKRAVVMNADERRTRDLLQKVTTIQKHTQEKRRAKKAEKRVDALKVRARLEERSMEKEKEQSKAYWKQEGKKRKAGLGTGGGGKRSKS